MFKKKGLLMCAVMCAVLMTTISANAGLVTWSSELLARLSMSRSMTSFLIPR